MFCDHSREMFRQIEDSKFEGKLQSKDLANTARSGCYFCFSLLGFLSHYHVSDLTDLHFKWKLQPVSEEDKSLLLHVSLTSPRPGYVHWCDFLFSASPRQLETYPMLLDLDPTSCYQAPAATSHPSLAKLAQSWLRTCVHEHSESLTRQDNHYRPPRLLNFSSGGLRLVKGSECGKNSEWATLSHCWGLHPTFLKLTSEILSQLELEIPMNSLPRTFKDASKFCDSIGIKFIWIDSLCIIQQGDGSKEDWFHHITEMRQVYRNATLNIAAEWAISAEDGIFRERDTISLQRPVIQLDSGPMKGCWQIESDSEILDLFSTSPLSSRAWVMQERFLSTRMVSFNAEQVYWRCNHGFKSERFPKGYHNHVAPPIFCRSLYTEYQHQSEFVRYEGQGSAKSRMLVQFLTEVSGYSGCALTYPDSDKFAAFSGIAAEYSHLFKEEYIAGFFKSHLPWALAWQVENPKPIQMDRKVGAPFYRSPSWSWAATDQEVQSSIAHSFYDSAFDPKFDGPINLLEITDTHVELVDPENKFGPLLHASLKLHASLLECTWEIHSEGSNEFSLKLQIEVEAVICFDSVEHCHSDQQNVRLMPLNVVLNLEIRGGDFTIAFLMLSRVLGSASPVYTRIGVGSIDDADSSIVDVFKSLPKEDIELV